MNSLLNDLQGIIRDSFDFAIKVLYLRESNPYEY